MPAFTLDFVGRADLLAGAIVYLSLTSNACRSVLVLAPGPDRFGDELHAHPSARIDVL